MELYDHAALLKAVREARVAAGFVAFTIHAHDSPTGTDGDMPEPRPAAGRHPRSAAEQPPELVPRSASVGELEGGEARAVRLYSFDLTNAGSDPPRSIRIWPRERTPRASGRADARLGGPKLHSSLVTAFNLVRSDGTCGTPDWRMRFDVHYAVGPIRLFYSASYQPTVPSSPTDTIETIRCR